MTSHKKDPSWAEVLRFIEDNPDGGTYIEIGSMFNPPLSKQRIEQIVLQALRKLRKSHLNELRQMAEVHIDSSYIPIRREG